MNDSICNFLPEKEYSGNIKTVLFVYETEFKKLSQPFFHPIHYVHIVTSGSAVMKIYGREYELNRGCVFFSFPAVPFEIDATEDFRYMYISFMGSAIPVLLDKFGVDLSHCVYPDRQELIDLWMSSVSRITQTNASALSEAVLLYTLSFLNSSYADASRMDNGDTVFNMIMDYIDGNFCDPNISLMQISKIFSYTVKYLSFLFKKKKGVGFSMYLKNLRIQQAHKLISEGIKSVAEISFSCGFRDPMYFSKVFKKINGCSPSEYIEKRNKTEA
ncbi:MAG: helix-turn-helix transcriptional regulator [Clostridia bacterium]|nr:helix-turn-helix transcriptional regulator [Clostridia bacterium]